MLLLSSNLVTMASLRSRAMVPILRGGEGFDVRLLSTRRYLSRKKEATRRGDYETPTRMMKGKLIPEARRKLDLLSHRVPRAVEPLHEPARERRHAQLLPQLGRDQRVAAAAV